MWNLQDLSREVGSWWIQPVNLKPCSSRCLCHLPQSPTNIKHSSKKVSSQVIKNYGSFILMTTAGFRPFPAPLLVWLYNPILGCLWKVTNIIQEKVPNKQTQLCIQMEVDIYSKQVTGFNMLQAAWSSTQKIRNSILRLMDNPTGPLTLYIYAWKCLIIQLQIICSRIQHWL